MLRSKPPQADKNGELSFIVSAISQVPRGWHSGLQFSTVAHGANPLIQTVFVSVSDWQLEIGSVCSPLGRKVAVPPFWSRPPWEVLQEHGTPVLRQLSRKKPGSLPTFRH
jgi:hypothetical protein